jgi:uncharacterized protein
MKATRISAVVAALVCVSCMNSPFETGPPITPLIAAARDGDTKTMAQLIASGADVNERGGVNNWTPLMHAVHKNQLAAANALVAAGADLNATAGARGRDTALSLALVQNEPEIASLLRAHGAKSQR